MINCVREKSLTMRFLGDTEQTRYRHGYGIVLLIFLYLLQYGRFFTDTDMDADANTDQRAEKNGIQTENIALYLTEVYSLATRDIAFRTTADCCTQVMKFSS